VSKRITVERVKKWLIYLGMVGVPAAIGFIWLMASLGSVDITGFQADDYCVGTYENPCYAYINISVKEDVFIYPSDNWSQTAFPTDPQMKEVILYRSWGTSWRKIPLNKSCTGTWCGLSNSKDTRVFSFAFREGRDYQLRVAFIKNNPTQDVVWGFKL